MQFLSVVRHVCALLAQMILWLVISLTGWALVLPLLLGWDATVVMSGSMMSSIKTGDILIADPMTRDELQDVLLPGHIVLAHDPARNGDLFTHRIIESNEANTEFTTKGDANTTEDSTALSIDSIKGVERILIPFAGYPVQKIETGDYLPAALYGFIVIGSFWIVMREKRIEEELMRLKEESTGETTRRGRRDAERIAENRLMQDKPMMFMLPVMLVSVMALGQLSPGSFASFYDKTQSADSVFTAAESFGGGTCWYETGDILYQNFTTNGGTPYDFRVSIRYVLSTNTIKYNITRNPIENFSGTYNFRVRVTNNGISKNAMSDAISEVDGRSGYVMFPIESGDTGFYFDYGFSTSMGGKVTYLSLGNATISIPDC